MDNFLSLIYSIIGGVIVGVFDFLFLRKQGELEKRVQHLETEKFAKLENKVDEHIKEDRNQEILTEIKHLSGALTKIDDKIEKIRRDGSEQNAEIKELKKENEAQNLYLKNLNDVLINHITNDK